MLYQLAFWVGLKSFSARYMLGSTALPALATAVALALCSGLPLMNPMR
jgi:hypothetical protein